MKIKSAAITLIAALVLFGGYAVAQQQSGSQQSDPSMQQSQSGSRQQMSSSSLTKNPDTVKQVQQALSSQGFDPGAADGRWGSKTQSALKKFQRSKGMQASGQLDQQTLASLGVSGSAAGGQEGMQDQQGDMTDQQSGSGGQQDSMSDQQSREGGSK